MPRFIVLILILGAGLQAKELLGIIADNKEIVRVDGDMGDSWGYVTAKADIGRALHGNLDAAASATESSLNLNLSGNFNVNLDIIKFGCRSFDVKLNADERLDFSIERDCFLTIDGFTLDSWDYLELVANDDGIAVNFADSFNVSAADLTILRVHNKAGCRFRAGYGYNSPSVIRAYYGTGFILLGDDEDHAGWLDVAIRSDSQGWVVVHVGKKLMETLTGKPMNEVHEKLPIPKLIVPDNNN